MIYLVLSTLNALQVVFLSHTAAGDDSAPAPGSIVETTSTDVAGTEITCCQW